MSEGSGIRPGLEARVPLRFPGMADSWVFKGFLDGARTPARPDTGWELNSDTFDSRRVVPSVLCLA